MENFIVVRPEHLNHYGYLFGGDLLRWVDEVSWIAASRDYPGCKFVTAGMEKVEFHKPVRAGTVLRFDIQRAVVGQSSVQYDVNVFADDLDTGCEQAIFSNRVTFVCLDQNGHKTRLPSQPGGCRPA